MQSLFIFILDCKKVKSLLKKSLHELMVLKGSKIAINGHRYTNTTEDENFIFCMNVHTPIEKQSNLQKVQKNTVLSNMDIQHIFNES